MDRLTEEGSLETIVSSGEAGEMSQNSATDDHASENQAFADRSGNSGSNGDDVRNARPLSPGTRALMCDEEDAMFLAAGSPNVTDHPRNMTQKSSNGYECTEVYAEQERLVLTRFRDFLNQLITCGSIKGKPVGFTILDSKF